MRVIGFEEHYATQEFLAGPGREFIERMSRATAQTPMPGAERLVERLTDVGGGRIAEMDAAGVDVAVLSLTAPGLEQLAPAEAIPFARDTNDYLADAVRRNPQRLRGFAALPTADAPTAADELERAVREHGFVGAESTGIAGAGGSTTSSSGRSWSAPRPSGSRSTCTPRARRSPSSICCTRGTTRLRSPSCCRSPAGAGTSKPQSMSCG